MQASMVQAEYADALPATSASERRLRRNGMIVIFSMATGLALVTASECQSITHLPSLIYGFALWGWWGCIAALLWRLGERIPAVSSFSWKAIATHLVAGPALGVAHWLLLGSLGFIVPGWWGTTPAYLAWTSLFSINRLGIGLLIYGFIFGVTGVIQSQIRAQRQAMQSVELQRQLSAAHLRALQMQLEPHFLFNTLNAITTLVELGRQKAAAEMLHHLNVILKSTLTRATPEKVPLSQELEFVGNYLAIERVRFADRLRVEITVDPNAVDGLVPCFLLQPIVENAIRHGIAHCENDGLVEAWATRDGDSLHVQVRDSGPRSLHTKQNGHGIGLSNTRERLTHFYQDGYTMRAQPLDTGGFEVAIRIPYESEVA
jgi:hypothetical protein